MSGKLANFVTWKHLVASIAAGFLVLASFAAWLIGQAHAEVAAHEANPNPHPGIELRFVALDAKIDKILWAILDDRRRNGVVPVEPPLPSPTLPASSAP